MGRGRVKTFIPPSYVGKRWLAEGDTKNISWVHGSLVIRWVYIKSYHFFPEDMKRHIGSYSDSLGWILEVETIKDKHIIKGSFRTATFRRSRYSKASLRLIAVWRKY